MAFWRGMATALKEKTEKDFQREILDRNFLEKRRDATLAAISARRSTEAELQKDMTDVYWMKDYFSGVEDSDAVQGVIDEASSNPAIASQLRSTVEGWQQENGMVLDPNAVLGGVTIHGVSGLNPDNVYDSAAALSQALSADVSGDELDQMYIDATRSAARAPTSSVSVDPTIFGAQTNKALDDQTKAYQGVLADVIARNLENGTLEDNAVELEWVQNLDKPGVFATAARKYGDQVQQFIQENYPDNPLLRNPERNPNLSAFVPNQNTNTAERLVVTTQEEVDALPSGTEFYGPDGTKYTKD